MNFNGAIKAVKEGRTVARASWEGKRYLKLVDYKVTGFRGVENELGFRYFPEGDDARADDWEITEPEAEKGAKGKRRRAHMDAWLGRQRDIERVRHGENPHAPTEEEADAIDAKRGFRMRRTRKEGGRAEYVYEEN